MCLEIVKILKQIFKSSIQEELSYENKEKDTVNNVTVCINGFGFVCIRMGSKESTIQDA